MKKLILTALFFILNFSIYAQNDEGSWDAYLATYENGKPGSTILRMDLIDKAPLEEYPKLLVTGFAYKSKIKDGFPDEKTLETLYEMEDKLEAFLKEQFDIIHVGSFMHNFERLGYYYIKSDENLEASLKKFYKTNFPKFKTYISIKDDAQWQAYTDFLYPNEEILNYMFNMKVIKALADAGDELTEARRIDHWIWFSNESNLKASIPEIEKLGYTVEEFKKSEDEENVYSLQIWKDGVPNMENITNETLNLMELAKKHEGTYDGWETFIVKK